jgi:vancomycin permeability regulator SanA
VRPEIATQQTQKHCHRAAYLKRQRNLKAVQDAPSVQQRHQQALDLKDSTAVSNSIQRAWDVMQVALQMRSLHTLRVSSAQPSR